VKRQPDPRRHDIQGVQDVARKYDVALHEAIVRSSPNGFDDGVGRIFLAAAANFA
jgi:hypothetical protein